MRFQLFVAHVAALSAVCLGVATASAQEVEGAFQLGIGTSVVDYTKVDLEYDLEALGEVEAESSTTQWGFGEASALLELGYGLSDAVVLGGFVQIGGESVSEDSDDLMIDAETSSTTIGLGPKVDFMFSRGAKVRPFLGVGVGFVSQSSDENETEVSLLGFQLFGRVGLRWFAAPGFSLDPALQASWAVASGDVEAATGDVDVSATSLAIGLGVTASGWID